MDKRKKHILIWTLIMAPFMIADAALMAYDILNSAWGGIIFIALWGLMVYGDYRIDKRFKVNSDGL